MTANRARSEGHRPSAQELEAATGKVLPDLIGPGLGVLFCGINPGRWSAAVGHHFARPGNRFWKALHASGFTEELLLPSSENLLLATGLGITNLVERCTASASELDRYELAEGARLLKIKVDRFRPKVVAILGIGAYRSAFGHPKATLGSQPETLAGSGLWLLPSPSGLQAYYRLEALTEELRKLRDALPDTASVSG